MGYDRFPVDPFAIAEAEEITIEPKAPDQVGVSGGIMFHNDNVRDFSMRPTSRVKGSADSLLRMSLAITFWKDTLRKYSRRHPSIFPKPVSHRERVQ